MKELYHKMKGEELDHLKIDIKDDFITNPNKDNKAANDNIVKENSKINTEAISQCPYQSNTKESGSGLE